MTENKTKHNPVMHNTKTVPQNSWNYLTST